MKYRVRVGDLVKYKVHYTSEKKQIGLVLRKNKAGAGMTELSILWNSGAITQTSLHMLRKIIQ
tara:strand:+ start:369 stop:557 length:189 start_codon:yes stop_codon:yes gene_type:complete